MKSYTKLLSLFTIACAYARQVTFRVICMEGTDVAVNVGGASQPMTQQNGLPYYQAVLDVSDPVSYSYSVSGQAESFSRSLDSSMSTTYNDFFGRAETVKELPQFGYPTNKHWERSLGKGEIFDDSYIPTIYITGGQQFFKTAPQGTTTFESLTIFLKNSVYTSNNVLASCKNRQQDKFQVLFGLENSIEKRSIFKLRPSSEDPAFMRQIIYSDMIHAVGNPTHESVACRVYSDGNPIGLYVLQEDVTTLSFIKSAFYGNKETGKIGVPSTGLGSPLDCATGADFQPDGDYSSFIPLQGKSNENIAKLADAISQLDVNNSDSIIQFSKNWFDLDIFFRAIAFEYLAGHWDSYWYFTTNFVMYDAPEESTSSSVKYYFVDQDFDLTWGCGLSDTINRYGQEFPTKSYNEDVHREWNISDADGANRYLIDLLLAGGLTKGMFEAHLVSIVKHIFNPVALGNKVNAYKDRILPEITWDASITRQYSSNNANKYTFTVDDFLTNIERGGKYHYWGIMDWTESRAKAVSSEFGFQWDQVPLTPETAKQVEVQDIVPIASGSDLSAYTGSQVTGVDDNGQIISSASSLEFLTKSLMAILALYLLF